MYAFIDCVQSGKWIWFAASAHQKWGEPQVKGIYCIQVVTGAVLKAKGAGGPNH